MLNALAFVLRIKSEIRIVTPMRLNDGKPVLKMDRMERTKGGRKKEPDSQSTFHIPPGYVTTTGFTINPFTNECFPVFLHHPSHTAVFYTGYINRRAGWRTTWPKVESGGPP